MQACEVLTKMCNYAAVALQNYRLLGECVEQRGFALDHLEDLHTSSEVIEAVVAAAKRCVMADYAVLFLTAQHEQDRDKYLLLYDNNQDDANDDGNKRGEDMKDDASDHGDPGDEYTPVEHDRWVMVSTNSLAGHCAKTGEVVNILDARRDARRDKDFDRILCAHRGRANFVRLAVLCVPIIDPRGNVTGVVQVMNKREVNGPGTYRYFVPADETKLMSLLGAAAVSMKSAMLHDAADKSFKRLHRLLEVTKAISREHDIYSLLKRVLDAAQDVVDATMSSIWTIDWDTRQLCSSFIVPGQVSAFLPTRAIHLQ